MEGPLKKDVLGLTQQPDVLKTGKFQNYNTSQMVAGSASPIDHAKRHLNQRSGSVESRRIISSALESEMNNMQ